MTKCAFDFEDSCKALKEKNCRGCHFYKTQEELEKGRRDATQKVSKLSPEERNYIRHKYYDGRGMG